jgi:hypothetical protein
MRTLMVSFDLSLSHAKKRHICSDGECSIRLNARPNNTIWKQIFAHLRIRGTFSMLVLRQDAKALIENFQLSFLAP